MKNLNESYVKKKTMTKVKNYFCSTKLYTFTTKEIKKIWQNKV